MVAKFAIVEFSMVLVEEVEVKLVSMGAEVGLAVKVVAAVIIFVVAMVGRAVADGIAVVAKVVTIVIEEVVLEFVDSTD